MKKRRRRSEHVALYSAHSFHSSLSPSFRSGADRRPLCRRTPLTYALCISSHLVPISCLTFGFSPLLNYIENRLMIFVTHLDSSSAFSLLPQLLIIVSMISELIF
jgi:hypothetical protein